MWKLYNYLFGWNYILYTDSATTFISRVIKTPAGILMLGGYCRGHYKALLQDDGKVRRGLWVPLTWDGDLTKESNDE